MDDDRTREPALAGLYHEHRMAAGERCNHVVERMRLLEEKVHLDIAGGSYHSGKDLGKAVRAPPAGAVLRSHRSEPLPS